MIYYADMVADLLHYGHINYIKQIYDTMIKNTDNKLYIGIHNDNTVKTYKRTPVLNMNERIKILEHIPYISKIIPNAPLEITKEYISKYNINYICIPDNRTEDEINKWYSYFNKNNLIVKFKYTDSISTSSIIDRIKHKY